MTVFQSIMEHAFAAVAERTTRFEGNPPRTSSTISTTTRITSGTEAAFYIGWTT
jgi:hypothetical protein